MTTIINNFQFPILYLGEDEVHDEKKQPLEEALGFLDVFLADNAFVCGENLTVADCCLVASVSSIVVRIGNIYIFIQCIPKSFIQMVQRFLLHLSQQNS